MSAELLRRAASLMRKRAERMPMPVRGYGMSSQWTTPTTMLSKVSTHGRVLMESRQNCDPYDGVYAADYFASWHPAVALAVARLLDDTAETWEMCDQDAAFRRGVHTIAVGYTREHALNLARAYLGESP